MTAAELRGMVRQYCGNPSVNQVPDRELDNYIRPALVWLANSLKWVEVITDNQIALVAGQAEYPLPRGFAWLVWVEVGTQLLTPTTTYALNAFGGDWRQTPNAPPTQYAVEGRSLILNPAPDAGTVASYPVFAWRYIGTGDDLVASGTPELSDMDQQLVYTQAAIEWLGVHPSDENQIRIQNYGSRIETLLPIAKQRWENAITTLYPTFSPETHGRLYASR